MGKWIKRKTIMTKVDYRSAGVDIDAGNEAVDRIKDKVRSTFTENVLTGLGSFGSLFDPLLPSSRRPRRPSEL